MPPPVYISAAVEGLVDEAVIRKLIQYAGGVPGPVYGKNGKAGLHARVSGYNNAARRSAWIVLVDLDSDHDCAVPLRQEWIPLPAAGLCFRVAVHAVEAWLLADARSIAGFLGVARPKVPGQPEALPYPKQALVNLARGSRRRAIRDDMVPRDGSGRLEGPAYTSRLIEFIQTSWRPAIAAENAESLRRAMACLTRLISAPDWRLGGGKG
jgi:hypothetical protein